MHFLILLLPTLGTTVFAYLSDTRFLSTKRQSSAVRDTVDLAYHARRALPNSPSGSYAPAVVPCPANRPAFRSASSLSPEETAWLAKRRAQTESPMLEFFRAKISGFDAAKYLSVPSAQPNIAIAISGGGYRALMNGAGFLKAADSRTPGSTDGTGAIGGLLQATTYLSGLSGGGWLVGSIFANNFSSITQLQQSSSVWRFSNSIFEGPKRQGINLGILDTASYWTDIVKQVSEKSKTGFETSITDFWGRALSYQLIGSKDGGPAFTFSSIALDSDFGAGQTPFPILVADGRAPGEKIISLSATNFEFGPFEMGSFDPTVFGFIPTRFLGSNFSNGGGDGNCVEGFDQLGFVMGTSSSLFNEFLLANISSFASIPGPVVSAVKAALTSLSDHDNDIAQYKPNPFLGHGANGLATAPQLTLVDGGEDGQNIPLWPLLQPARAADVIFAVDSSADTRFNWPNGTALAATRARSLSALANGTRFPDMPDQATMVARGFNNRPTFFGCDGAAGGPPLVVYMPNAPYSAASNVSTFDPAYEDAQRDAIIQNGVDGATQGGGRLDARWGACVACAVLSRSLARTGTAVPPDCVDCFKRYCWDGKSVGPGDAPVAEYEPVFKLEGVATGSTATKDQAVTGGVRATSGAESRRWPVWLVALGVTCTLLTM